jgi:hypothetical protein
VEKEWRDLSMIDVALCAADLGEICELPPRPKQLPVKRLKEIADEVSK